MVGQRTQRGLPVRLSRPEHHGQGRHRPQHQPEHIQDFSRRLVEYAEETGRNLMQEVFESIATTIDGFDIDGSTQRMDSTFIEAYIKQLSRLDLIAKVVHPFISTSWRASPKISRHSPPTRISTSPTGCRLARLNPRYKYSSSRRPGSSTDSRTTMISPNSRALITSSASSTTSATASPNYQRRSCRNRREPIMTMTRSRTAIPSDHPMTATRARQRGRAGG